MSADFGNDSLWLWVLKNSDVNYPNRRYWSVSANLGGIDIMGSGTTIQNAYKDLYELIEKSEHLFKAYANL